MNKPKSMDSVVVLIPTFNSADTIQATLASLQAQQGLQRVSTVYLADDASSDNTRELVTKAWHASIPLEILRREHNVGQWVNVNEALRVANSQADWTLILHGDDVVKPKWLSSMLERIDNCAPVVATICSSWDDLLPDGTIRPGEDDSLRAVELIEGRPKEIVGTLRRGCWWHVSGCALKMRAFQDVGDFSLQVPQLGDWEWLLRCLSSGWSVEYIPRTLLVYRLHDASVSSKSFSTDKDVLESLAIIREYLSLLSTRDLLTLHSAFFVRLMRRFARAIIKFRLKRCVGVLKNLLLVITSLVRSLRNPGLSAGLIPAKS